MPTTVLVIVVVVVVMVVVVVIHVLVCSVFAVQPSLKGGREREEVRESERDRVMRRKDPWAVDTWVAFGICT